MDISAAGSATFLINAVSDASILLWDDKNDVTPMELVIGGWGNYRCVIRQKPQADAIADTSYPDPVLSYEYQNIEYWMDWSPTSVRFGRVCSTRHCCCTAHTACMLACGLHGQSQLLLFALVECFNAHAKWCPVCRPTDGHRLYILGP